MNKFFYSRRGGFTLVEIMIVVAIIALLAALAVPNFLRARKRSQATLVLEDLRVLDHALEQYAADGNYPADTVVQFSDLQGYVKEGTKLRNTGADVFGNAYGPFLTNNFPDVPSDTFVALADVVEAEFWEPYD